MSGRREPLHTGVDADLATLRAFAGASPRRHAALARVEAELSRLRELTERQDMNIKALYHQKRTAERRAEAAEARCAELEDALDRERDNHAAALRINQHAAEQWEARCARLQQALRPFLDASYGYREDIGYPVWRISVSESQYQEASEALAGLDADVAQLRAVREGK